MVCALYFSRTPSMSNNFTSIEWIHFSCIKGNDLWNYKNSNVPGGSLRKVSYLTIEYCQQTLSTTKNPCD